MRNRTIAVSLSTLAVAALLPAAALAQTQSDGEPLTPWGDPNLEGTWSYASLTPLQRPAGLGDRRHYTEEEAAARNLEVTLDREPPPGSVGSYNALWFDRGRVSPDLRTSLIIDPPNGRLPITAETAAQAETDRAYRAEHPADSHLDRSNWDRCITYHGVPPVSTGYNNTYQIVQTPDHVAIRVENIHDVRIIPIDGRDPLTDGIRQWNGDSRGHCRDAQLQRQDPAPLPVLAEHRRGGALPPPGRRHPRAHLHHRGFDGLHAALDRHAAHAAAARLHHLRVRLPRGQLRDDEPAARRADLGGDGAALTLEPMGPPGR
ncbi:MAG: hypothetical protein J4G16_04370 [Acidobacteria bacterium]|nr:hypothetical protein [Acidobacteriota bacterium]